MNTAQQEVLDKVIEMLGEHFEHVVVAVGWMQDETDDKQYCTSATYTGGVVPAVGLCKVYEKKWIKEHLWGSEDDQP